MVYIGALIFLDRPQLHHLFFVVLASAWSAEPGFFLEMSFDLRRPTGPDVGGIGLLVQPGDPSQSFKLTVVALRPGFCCPQYSEYVAWMSLSLESGGDGSAPLVRFNGSTVIAGGRTAIFGG